MSGSLAIFAICALVALPKVIGQPDCSADSLTLFAGQNIEAGTVDITNSENTFIISFHLNEGWVIHEAHFYVGTTPPDNNPGGYPYHLSPGTYNSSFTWIIDATDFVAQCEANLFTALHAVVSNGNQLVETAWNDCTHEFGQGWGSYCDNYIYKCGCEDPEDPNPGDLECCDCDTPGTGCPTSQTHRFDLVWGGGNLGQNYESNDFADVFMTVDIASETVTLFLEEDEAGFVHQDRYELKEIHVGVSTDHTDDWPNGFGAPWVKIEFDPPLAILKDDNVITTFMRVFNFSDFCCLDFTQTPACESTFYIAVHTAVCVWDNCTAPPPLPIPDQPCVEVPDEETAYGLCPDANTNSSNCYTSGKNGIWAQASSIEFCCNDTGPPPPPPPNGPCTRTIGYWKTHNKYRTQGTQMIPWPELILAECTEDREFSSCDSLSWLEILWEPVKGNKWLILAKQYIGAVLNIASGTDSTDIDAYLPCAEEMLTLHSLDCHLINKNVKVCGKSVTKLASIFDLYNNGVTGPGHCDSDTIFCPEQCFCTPDNGNTTKRSVSTRSTDSVIIPTRAISDGRSTKRSVITQSSANYVTPTVCFDDEPKTLRLTGFSSNTAFGLIQSDECNIKRVGLYRRVGDDGIITLTFIGKGCCAAEVDV